MSLLRPGIIKQHKTNPNMSVQCEIYSSSQILIISLQGIILHKHYVTIAILKKGDMTYYSNSYIPEQVCFEECSPSIGSSACNTWQ